jgi:hypothetical protein
VVSWQLTIDCTDPARLVRFWGPALGYEVQPPPEGFETWKAWYASMGVPEEELDDGGGDWVDRIYDPAGAGPKIWFQPVPERKSIKNRLHLDVYVTGGRSEPPEERRPVIEARVAELVEAGATVFRREPGGVAVTMQDPEGNEFCVA